MAGSRLLTVALVVLLAAACGAGDDADQKRLAEQEQRIAELETALSDGSTTTPDSTADSSADRVRVPDVVGQTEEYARGALEAAGLEIVVQTEESSDSAPGVVSRQVPNAGDDVGEGTQVMVVVAEPASSSSTTTTMVGFSQSVRDSYLDGCMEDGNEAFCICTLEEFEKIYTEDEFERLAMELGSPEEAPDEFVQVILGCLSALGD